MTFWPSSDPFLGVFTWSSFVLRKLLETLARQFPALRADLAIA